MTDQPEQTPVPTPAPDAEVKLSIGVDEEAKAVALVLEVRGGGKDLRVKINYDTEDAAKLATTIATAVMHLRRKFPKAAAKSVVIPTKNGIIRPKFGGP